MTKSDYAKDGVMIRRDEEERKKLIKQAIDEWLEHKYAMIGRWTVGGIVAALVAVLGYVYFSAHGIHK